jgi:uncharacterized protein (TIGR02147 family)
MEKNTQPTPVFFLDFRRHLSDELSLRQRRNSRYSLRAFARFLKIDAPTLQKIISGRRALGAKTLRSLAKRLELEEGEIGRYVHAHEERRRLGISLDFDRKHVSYKLLGAESLALMGRWQAYAALELTYLPYFQMSAESLAPALRMSFQEATELLREMEKADWLVKDVDGRYLSKIGPTSTDPSDPNVRKMRRQLMEQILEVSRESYSNVPQKFAAHYARTFAFDRRLLNQVMVEIRKFGNSIQGLTNGEGTERNEIYQLQLGFYPLTRFYDDSEDD